MRPYDNGDRNNTKYNMERDVKRIFFHYSKKYDVVILESLPEDDRALDPTVK